MAWIKRGIIGAAVFLALVTWNGPVRGDYLVTLRNAYFDAGVNRIARLSDSGLYLGEFVPPAQITASQLSGPTGMQLDAAGNLLVTSTFDNRILRFDGDTGVYMGTFAPSIPVPLPALDGPSALRFRSPQELLVANLGNAQSGFVGGTVTRLDADGGGSFGNFGSGHVGAAGLLISGTDVLVSEFTSNQVLRFNASGALQQTITDGLIAGPTGLATDPNTGNLLIASVSGDRIVQVNGATASTFVDTPPQFFPSGVYFTDTSHYLVYSAAVGTILKYEVGSPIPSVFIDYAALGINPNDLLSGVAIGDILHVPSRPGDFDANGLFNCADVDALVQAVVVGSNAPAYDLTGDGFVTRVDLTAWRGLAGAILNASGNPIIEGDSNLDGSVDGTDFGIWNSRKFTSVAAWCAGDFNADGSVDGSDFGIWNTHKFTSADAVTTVPEPTFLAGSWLLGLLASMLVPGRLRR